MTIKYYDNYQPALKTGAYIVEVEQNLSDDDLQEKFSNSADLTINKTTKSLTTQAIQSVYPPIDGQGDFDAVLPKIVLQDASLPWQNSTDEITPTLALLIFEADELEIEDWTKVSRTGANFPNHNQDGNLFIDVPIKYLKSSLPKQEELAFLSHVQTTDEVNYSTTIFSNRLPKSNSRNIVHLVDLQHFNYDQLNQNSTNQKVSFQSLTSWEFYCEAPKEEFEIVAKNLVENHQLLRLNIEEHIENETIKTAFEGGFIPLKYEMQQGEHTTAFYRSPLVPMIIKNQNFEPNFSAESAMIYDTNKGIFDVSYAVAWQTGRLLALSDAYFSQNLLKWKRTANSFLDTFFAKQHFYKNVLSIVNTNENTNFTLDDLMSNNNNNHLIINSLQTALNNLGLASRGDLGGIRTADELQERATLELADLKGILDKSKFEQIENSTTLYESILEVLFK